MAILLPVIAILAVTGEWSQRTGLITFTLIPHRGQVILAKALAAIMVGVVGMLGRVRHRRARQRSGSRLNGVDLTWDISASDMFWIISPSLGLLIGFMLGVLIRNTPGAIVAYFVYSFVLPTIFGILAETGRLVTGRAAVDRLQLRPGADVRRRPHAARSGRISERPD